MGYDQVADGCDLIMASVTSHQVLVLKMVGVITGRMIKGHVLVMYRILAPRHSSDPIWEKSSLDQLSLGFDPSSYLSDTFVSSSSTRINQQYRGRGEWRNHNQHGS